MGILKHILLTLNKLRSFILYSWEILPRRTSISHRLVACKFLKYTLVTLRLSCNKKNCQKVNWSIFLWWNTQKGQDTVKKTKDYEISLVRIAQAALEIRPERILRLVYYNASAPFLNIQFEERAATIGIFLTRSKKQHLVYTRIVWDSVFRRIKRRRRTREKKGCAKELRGVCVAAAARLARWGPRGRPGGPISCTHGLKGAAALNWFFAAAFRNFFETRCVQ